MSNHFRFAHLVQDTYRPFRTRHHPADEVYVTGTFDDWAKSVKLEKKGDRFEKLLDLPQTEEKTFYKVRGVSCALRILDWYCA